MRKIILFGLLLFIIQMFIIQIALADVDAYTKVLSEGETIGFDLNNDGVDDIFIKANRCINRSANITLELVSEEIVEEAKAGEIEWEEDEGWADYIPKKEEKVAVPGVFREVWHTAKHVASNIPYLRHILTGIIIFVAILVIYFKWQRKHKKGNKRKKRNVAKAVGRWFADLFFVDGKKKG